MINKNGKNEQYFFLKFDKVAKFLDTKVIEVF